MSRAPIFPLVIGNNGAYKALRASSAQGSCGVHGYPCLHPGVDVVGRAGTPVMAPEAGVIAVVADGNSPPWSGYGPWLVLIKGDSGKYHLLAHLEPATAALGPYGMRVTEGQVIGKTSSANHTHWEVRTKPTPGAGKTNLDNNTDPIAWMRGLSVWLVAVMAAGGYFMYRLWGKKR